MHISETLNEVAVLGEVKSQDVIKINCRKFSKMKMHYCEILRKVLSHVVT